MTDPDTSAGPVLLVVGAPHPLLQGRVLPEGPMVDINRTGIHVWASYASPTAREVRGAREGKMRLALVPGGAHTLFVLLQVDMLAKGWADMPYALGRMPRETWLPPSANPKAGRFVLLTLIDQPGGIVRALRGVSTTPAFCAELDRLLAALAAESAHYTEAAHVAEIEVAYRRWPNADAMVRHATIVETAGLPFETLPRAP